MDCLLIDSLCGLSFGIETHETTAGIQFICAQLASDLVGELTEGLGQGLHC